MMQYWGHTYTKSDYYLKFKFYWAFLFCIATPIAEHLGLCLVSDLYSNLFIFLPRKGKQGAVSFSS